MKSQKKGRSAADDLALRVKIGSTPKMGRTLFIANVSRAAAGLALGLLLTMGSPTRADEPANPEETRPAPNAPNVAAPPQSQTFKICTAQTYALCATASCFVFNDLAYCKCNVKSGDSIGLEFAYGSSKNVCTVNAKGAGNGYMVSTFSLPESVTSPAGEKALYTCPKSTSDGAYAQCDGGICFTSTEGQSFPGFGKRLKGNQIICACPIIVANPATATTGYQIAGPFPCQDSFFENCKSTVANTNTGATVHVGAPTGTARLLTQMLYGSVPPLNRCPPPRD